MPMHALTKEKQQTDKIENLLAIEDTIVPVSEVFRLQGAAELQEAEKRYLPKAADDFSAIVLAASRGKELGVPVNRRPYHRKLQQLSY